ncbi:873_t:CDS:2 [Funneliformis mosseae]|uniref:Cysteine protease n=1 Tax=Funneliformis mosseae TaxID=27381 RepID=A0A9N8YU31_FUNMO|nr:873_t:CDS:2 [Funneliformis mosseae]
MDSIGVLASEPIKVDDFTKSIERNSEDSISLSDGGIRETSMTEAEVLDGLDEEVDFSDSPRPRPRPKLERSNADNISIEKENIGTGEVTKRLSSWISSFWIPSQDTNEDESDKDDPDYVRFKKGLFDSLDNVRSTIWLMGVHYEFNDDRSSSESNGNFYEASSYYYYTTPGTFPHLSVQQQTLSSTNYPAEFVQDFTSRIWCTYRHNYAPIKPTNFTNDGGWGCMLRSGQSLLANALIVQFLGREWRRVNRGEDTWNRYILAWFIDDMSSRCPFSVHRVALLGKQLGKNIGQWFGPSTASQAIKALVEDYPAAQLSVHIATDGVVYKNEVYNAAQNNRSGKDFQSVLILVATRLGTDKLNSIYYDALKAYFRFPHSVGIAGQGEAIFFILLYWNSRFDRDDLLYLDPHHSRPALELKAIQEFTEEEMSTFHCDTLRKIPISQLDPSMLLGFYCRNSEEFENFCNLVEEISKDNAPVLTIAQEAPVYDFDFDVVSDEEDCEKYNLEDE